MFKSLSVGLVGLGLVLGIAARADAGQARELWMASAPAGAPDDAEAELTFVGLMASGAACSAIAEVMTAHMRTDQSKVVAAFECRLHVELEQN